VALFHIGWTARAERVEFLSSVGLIGAITSLVTMFFFAHGSSLVYFDCRVYDEVSNAVKRLEGLTSKYSHHWWIFAVPKIFEASLYGTVFGMAILGALLLLKSVDHETGSLQFLDKKGFGVSKIPADCLSVLDALAPHRIERSLNVFLSVVSPTLFIKPLFKDQLLSWGLASPCQVEVIRIVLLLSLVAIKIRAASSHLELSILRSMSTPGHANKDLQTEIEEWKRRTSMWKSRIHWRMLEHVAVPMFLLLLIALNIASSGFEVCCLARRVDSLSTPVEVQAGLWRHPCVVDIQRDHESVVCRLTTLKEASRMASNIVYNSIQFSFS